MLAPARSGSRPADSAGGAGITDGQFAPTVFLFTATVTDDVSVLSVHVLIHGNIQYSCQHPADGL